MKHRYFDFYMRFGSNEEAQQAQEYYNKTFKSKIGGKFNVNANGVCSLSVRDDFEVINSLYDYGMKRFIVVDDFHGFRSDGKHEVFEFLTDTDHKHQFESDETLFEHINSFLKEEIYADGYQRQDGENAPVIQRYTDTDNYDDMFDILHVTVPGFDL